MPELRDHEVIDVDGHPVGKVRDVLFNDSGRPSWAIVATSDNAISPDAERHMAQRAGAQKIVEVDASHSIALSQPAAVAELIRTAVEATWGYLSTVTRPLAERGYYVFPVAVVDQFLKDNGLPTAGEMHQVPLEKAREILGADAVLFITVEQYGSKYQVLNSSTIVAARAKLVDTRSGTLLWEGRRVWQQNSSAGQSSLIGMLVAAAVTQIISTSTDAARGVSRTTNVMLFHTRDEGLLPGPYHPEYLKGQ